MVAWFEILKMHPDIIRIIWERCEALTALQNDGPPDEQEYARQYAIYLNIRRSAIATADASPTIAAPMMAASRRVLEEARHKFGYQKRQSRAREIEAMVSASQLCEDLPADLGKEPEPNAVLAEEDLSELPLPLSDVVL